MSMYDGSSLSERKAIAKQARGDFPKIVCLCGSTRFGEAFQKAMLEETLAGNIVLSIGCNMKSDTEIFGHLPEDELKRIKADLDELHKRKIDLADEVLILNVGNYVGESTQSELAYAYEHDKRVRFLESNQQLEEVWNKDIKLGAEVERLRIYVEVLEEALKQLRAGKFL